jgi:putative flippase GtrA
MTSDTDTLDLNIPLKECRFRSQWEHTSIQFFRYVLVGLISLSVDYGSLFLFIEALGLFYLLAAPLAFLIGILVNYTLSIQWVFQRRSLKCKSLEFSIYTSFGVLGLLLNEAIICIFTEIFAFHYLISKSLYLLVYILLFVARKMLLFR